MTLKAKIKFKPVYQNGSQDDNDVIVIKVKRKHWEDFSQLLAAARNNTDNYPIVHSEVATIERQFDGVMCPNS